MMEETLKIKHGQITGNSSAYSTKFDQVMHEQIIRKFSGLIRGKRCLELGCYYGEMTERLAETAKELTAIDFDKNCVMVTKERCKGKKNVAVLECEFSQFLDYAAYEIIMIQHSLEHVEKRRDLLEHIKNQIAQSNSLVLIIVPNAKSLSRQIAVEMGLIQSIHDVTDFEKQIGHTITYDGSILQTEVEDAGFEIIESGGLIPKLMSNLQYDRAIEAEILDDRYFDALGRLSGRYPEICSSIYVLVRAS